MRSHGCKTWAFCKLGLGAALMLLAGMGTPARGEFRVCNQTLNLFNISVGYLVEGAQVAEEEGWWTEGWWTLAANSCTSPIKKELKSKFYYLYGTDIYGEAAIVGETNLCVSAKQFVIRGIEDCWVRGFEQVRFLEVDTRSAESWTVFIRER